MRKLTQDYVNVIRDLEVALCIDGEDYANRNIDVAFNNILKRIQKQYHIDLSLPREDMYAASMRGETKQFLDSMLYVYRAVTALSHYIRFTGSTPFNLDSINYFGFTRVSFKSLLRSLQLEGFTVDDQLEMLKRALSNVSMCNEKKLVITMLIAYDLHLYELAGAIAELLYMEV